jgi:hypothetical protein
MEEPKKRTEISGDHEDEDTHSTKQKVAECRDGEVQTRSLLMCDGFKEVREEFTSAVHKNKLLKVQYILVKLGVPMVKLGKFKSLPEMFCRLCGSSNKLDIEIVEVLIFCGADKNRVCPIKTKDDTTVLMAPLSYACEKGLEKNVRILVGTGADRHILAEEQMTPLHFACANLRVGAVRALLYYYGTDVERKDESGHTPLLTLCAADLEVIAAERVAEGEDPDPDDCKEEQEALAMARAAEEELEEGEEDEGDDEEPEKTGTELAEALYKKKLEYRTLVIARELLKAGADKYALTDEGHDTSDVMPEQNEELLHLLETFK